jgi:hypothetical protein
MLTETTYSSQCLTVSRRGVLQSNLILCQSLLMKYLKMLIEFITLLKCTRY